MKGRLTCFLLGTFVAVTLGQAPAPPVESTADKLKKIGTTSPLGSQTGFYDEQFPTYVGNFTEHPEVTRMMQHFTIDIASQGAIRLTTEVPAAAGFTLGGLVYVLGYKTALQKDTEVYYVRCAFHNDAGMFQGYSFIFHAKITVEMAPGKPHWNWSPADLEENVKKARLIKVAGPKPDNTPLDVKKDFNDENVLLIGRSLSKDIFLKLSSKKDIKTLQLLPGETKENAITSPWVTQYLAEIMKLALAVIQKVNPEFTDFETKDSVGVIAYLSNTDNSVAFARVLIDSKFIFHLKFEFAIVDGKVAPKFKATGPKDVGEVIRPAEFIDWSLIY